jgi:uncharacterized protein YbaR (Trm112 family)
VAAAEPPAAAIGKLLACPVCHERLTLASDPVACSGCERAYPVVDGVAVLVADAAPDTWVEAETAIGRALAEDPELERLLLGSAIETLAPADRLLRAQVLEERGDVEGARSAAASADEGLYLPEVRECRDALLERVTELAAGATGPVVDVASGRCTLVERLAAAVRRPLVASDVSPTVLARTRRSGRLPGVTFLAFDARRTPFRDHSVPVLTTHLGLANIPHTVEVLRELRRVAAGPFLATAAFYPEDDEVNAAAIRELGLGGTLFRSTALAAFADAGWNARIESERRSGAAPTPLSELFPGVRVDALPAAETELRRGASDRRRGRRA